MAFIELHGDVGYYTPKYMEANLATTEELPQQLCKLGRITGETCGDLTHGPEKVGSTQGILALRPPPRVPESAVRKGIREDPYTHRCQGQRCYRSGLWHDQANPGKP